VFWRQFEIAKELASLGDTRALVALEPLLRHDDRHLRANAAFVFARLGDPRGLDTIKGILADRSDRPLRQVVRTGLSKRRHGDSDVPDDSGQNRASMARQIREDRYYAVHMLGELRDRHALDTLLPLLRDPDVNHHVAWALGVIGDPRAIAPLIRTLRDHDALVRISAIQALDALGATEAVPQLRELVIDQALPQAGDRVPVGDVAKAAIRRLTKG
jgi:HEAT repeat protein